MLYFIFINMLEKKSNKIWSIEFDIYKNNLTKSSILKKCKKKNSIYMSKLVKVIVSEHVV